MTVYLDMNVVWLMLAIAVIGFVVTYLVYHKLMVSRIEVTPAGLKTSFWGEENMLHWQDMRVFARYTMGIRKRVTYYEVSGQGMTGPVVVRWYWPKRPGIFTALRPYMAPSEYEAFPKQLEALIVAKTGHPVLDFNAGK